jgi:hypothetical protein
MSPAWRSLFTASGPTTNSVVAASLGLLTMASTSIFLPLFSQLTCHLIVTSLTNPLEIWRLYNPFIMSNCSVQPRFIPWLGNPFGIPWNSRINLIPDLLNSRIFIAILFFRM